MSNDRHQDERVSEAYRSLASEKAPQHLDHKILKLAAAAAKRPSYSRWMAWSRPLAWAATITLCLAITLELAREPSLEPTLATPGDRVLELTKPESQYIGEPARDAIDANSRKDEAAVLEKEQSREMPAALADAIASEKTALGRSAASQPASAANQPASEPAPAARLRYEDKSAAKMTSADAEADMAIEEIVVIRDCPEASQSDPETWLECILGLEEAGNTEAAEHEREALLDTFPDFKLP